MIKFIKSLGEDGIKSATKGLFTSTVVKYIAGFIVVIIMAIIISGIMRIKYLERQNKLCVESMISLGVENENVRSANIWNQAMIEDMNQTARDNAEELRLSNIRISEGLEALNASRDELRRTTLESDIRLKEAYSNNTEWAKTPVPVSVCENIL